MQKSSKNSIEKYPNWEVVFAFAKPMKFNAFNSGRITGKVNTYADMTSFHKNKLFKNEGVSLVPIVGESNGLRFAYKF